MDIEMKICTVKRRCLEVQMKSDLYRDYNEYILKSNIGLDHQFS